MKRKKTTKTKTTLANALEAGEDIRGMGGYVAIHPDREEEDKVFIKVRVLGLSTGEAACDLKVQVQPVSGSGTFFISPCQWIATPQDVEQIRILKAKTEAAINIFRTIGRNHYLFHRRDALVNYVKANMTGKQLEDFAAHCRAELGQPEGTDLPSLSKASKEQLRKLTATAVCIVNGLPADVLEDHEYSFRWN
jgi:hypothetical protein